jgi:predicted metalloprotease
VGLGQNLVSGVVAIVSAVVMGLLAVLYVAVVFGVGVAAVVGLGRTFISTPRTSTSKMKASNSNRQAEARRQTVEPDLTAAYRLPVPPVRRQP